MNTDDSTSDAGGATSDTPEQKLTKIRGWLLVLCIILFPHIITSALLLIKSLPFVISLSVETLRLVTQAVMLVGHSTGLILIFKRNRYTPAYFTLYVPLLLLLTLADPDLAATQMANAEILGRQPLEGAAAVARVASLAVTVLIWAYWLRSKRVRAVFGSVGLGALRRSASGIAK